MDLNRVRMFVQVAESGSFSAAARLLDLPKSSLSRGVAALEAEVGARLLARTTRKLRLTEAGRAFFDTAQRSLAGLQDAVAAVSQLQEAPQGLLRITAPSDMAVGLLAPLVARFAQRHPQLRVEVSATQRVINLVEEGFDLALRVGALRDATLVARPLGLVHNGAFAAASYLKKRGMPHKVQDLLSHDCICFRSSSGPAPWQLIGPAGRVELPVQGRLQADEFQFVQEACAAGSGIALLPLYAARGDRRLQRLLPQYATAGAPLHIVYPSARFLPKRVSLLRDYLLAELPELLNE